MSDETRAFNETQPAAESEWVVTVRDNPPVTVRAHDEAEARRKGLEQLGVINSDHPVGCCLAEEYQARHPLGEHRPPMVGAPVVPGPRPFDTPPELGEGQGGPTDPQNKAREDDTAEHPVQAQAHEDVVTEPVIEPVVEEQRHGKGRKGRRGGTTDDPVWEG